MLKVADPRRIRLDFSKPGLVPASRNHHILFQLHQPGFQIINDPVPEIQKPVPGWRLLWGQLFFQQTQKNRFVDMHEKRPDIKLQIISRQFLIFGDFQHKLLQTVYRPMDALALAGGKGIINKSRFINFFQFPDHQVMDNPVPEISCKNFPHFGPAGNKTDRARGLVRAVLQLPRQVKQLRRRASNSNRCVLIVPRFRRRQSRYAR
ncbi:MAG: hypothetical protein ACLFPD_07740 [Desulfosudaceae bacterium]